MKNEMNENMSNIYRLEGRVPIMKAIPFGLQHILAMFVRIKLNANYHHCGSWRAGPGRNRGSSAECHVHSRYCNLNPALSNLENWFRASYCNGSQLYFCNNTQYSSSELRLSNGHRSRPGGRYYGGNFRTSG